MPLDCGDFMLSKFDYSKNFLEKDNLLICPICKEKLFLQAHSLVCKNRHNYNVSKKGVTTLVSNNHIKVSKIYNCDLFLNRKKFIKKMFYQKLYNKIIDVINEKLNRKINILDLGCGEGSHTINILNALKSEYMYYGFDYSKVAIDLASDYNSDSRFYFVAGVNNIPVKDNSIDLILDILSPYNRGEVKRLLKEDGLFIKVSPAANYLKELREMTNISSYEKELEVKQNLETSFKEVQRIKISDTYPITNEEFNLLLKMSPMHNENIIATPKQITIDLVIYIISGEKL